MNWEVEIIGDNSDLEELSKVFTGNDLSIVKKDEYFVLRSKYLDALSDYYEVETQVIELLKSVNACAKLTLNSLKVIELESISSLDENKKRKTFFKDTCVTIVRCKDSICEVSPSNGTIEMCNQAMLVRNWIEVAQKDRSVKKIFTQINYEFDTWIGLYNVLEILQQAQFEPVGKNGIYREMVNDITQKANSYEAILEKSRHPGKSVPPPKNEIEILEAKSFVKMVLFQWLAQKEQEWFNQKNRSI